MPSRAILSRNGLLAAAVALAVIVADQVSKAQVLSAFERAGVRHFDILPVLGFSLVHNSGMSFGLGGRGTAGRWLFGLFALAVSVLLGDMARKTAKPLLAVGFGLIVGGALGNAIDRLRIGAVVDFLDVSGLGFFPWVFNLADSAITVGVILLLADLLAEELVKRRTA